MSKSVITILTFLLSIGSLLAQDGLRIMESLVMNSRILNQEVKYSVILPENYYHENTAYPVVFMLHGLGDDETAWLEFGRISQYYDAEINAGAITPMIFILPQGYRTYYVNDFQGTFLYRDMFINELVPFIDSTYRTIPDSRHRGLTGYSMGGFGALLLHLQHPDIFGSTVPLSISIRTDGQYMTEYAPEWNEQWGRLFGAVGIEGPARITEYYKLNNPFHIIPEIPASEFNKFRIYIDNGDKEQTLCRSNEELHILMRNTGFPHEFRVRRGGHSFEYWCSALPNALHFLSDAFEGKSYRGDVENATVESGSTENFFLPLSKFIDDKQISVFAPEDYSTTGRLYPALYLTGNLENEQVSRIVSLIGRMIKENEIGPMVVIIIPELTASELQSLMPRLEDEFRLRKDYHFRSILGYGENAEQVCNIVMNHVQFSSCILADAFLDKNKVIEMISGMPAEALKKTPFFIVAPDKGNYYEGNGNMHIIFRDKDIRHEYRVVEGAGSIEIFDQYLPEIINFISDNFHR